MGHVDHGKTTLLDAIRKTNITAKEHGGITQHIDSYQIKHKKKKITFIDTPGHAAFAKMRSYGAKVTDLVILVIAANDGVKPQTKECLKHIKKDNIPFLVCVNKIDLPEASVEKVKNQLTKEGVLVEEYGGDIVCVEVSAKQKKGLDDLLEMTLLLAEMQNLQVNKNKSFEGVIIDSRLDSKKGPVATVLVKKGVIKIGDQVFAEDVNGKVKALTDENGKNVKKAESSEPIKVLGFKKVPAIGAKVGKKKSKRKEIKSTVLKAEKKEAKLKIILKTDTKGTLEAIQTNLSEEIDIISANVGQINESDVLLALSTQAQILGFNVKTPLSVKKLAKIEKVKIKTYNIIYKLLEDLEKRILKILEPTIDEEILGEAEIIAEFTIKNNHIAGCKIKKGKISKKDQLHLKRKDKILNDARIKSFQKEGEESEEAKAGEEVGIVLSPDLDFKIGDAIISYKTQD
jgi:translation initiation factor IF-2